MNMTLKEEIKILNKETMEYYEFRNELKKMIENLSLDNSTTIGELCDIIDFNYNSSNDKIKDLIEKRNTCDHDFEHEGNDSHRDYYKCKKCGKEYFV